VNQATDSIIDFATEAPVAGSLDVKWIHSARSRRRGDEPKLQAHQVAGRQGRHVFDDFVIFNQPSISTQLKLMAGGLAAKVVGRCCVAPGNVTRR
jgi:hypothetical protein